MSDINKIIIENFQSHEHTVVEFDMGLNVIVGPSDQGKSAIIRALKWVLYNEPRGIEFIRHGATTARVTIEMSNGYKITRERSKSRNKYIVTDQEDRAIVLEGFGNEVPDEVIKAHGIPKIVLDRDLRSSLNIADQLEGPFLLSETGATRAKAIGRLTGVHIIDNAIRECMIDIRRENQSQDRITGELDDTVTRLKEYENLDLIERKIKDTDSIISKLAMLIDRKQKLEALNAKFNYIETEYNDLQRKIARMGNLDNCKVVLTECSAKLGKLNKITRLEQNLLSMDKEIGRSSVILVKTKSLDESYRLLTDSNKKNIMLEKLRNMKIAYSKVSDELVRIDKIIEMTQGLNKAQAYIKKTEIKFSQITRLTEIKEKYKNNKIEIERVTGYLNKSKRIDESYEVLEKVRTKIDMLKVMLEARLQFETLTNYILEGEKYLQNNKIQNANLLKEYSGILKKVGKCPLCGSVISETKIKDILKHYEEAH